MVFFGIKGINKVAQLISVVFVSLLLFVSCVMADKDECKNEEYRSKHADECNKNVENTVPPTNPQSDNRKKNEKIGSTPIDKTQQLDPKNCCEDDVDYSVDQFLACMSEETCIVNSGNRTIPNDPKFRYLKLPECVDGNIESFTDRVKKESEKISLVYEELKVINSSDEIIDVCDSPPGFIEGTISTLQRVNNIELAKQLQKTKSCFVEIDKWIGSSKEGEKARRIRATSNLNKVREEWDSNVRSLVSVHQVQRKELIKYIEKRDSYMKQCSPF
jgi:hypothetical protein